MSEDTDRFRSCVLQVLKMARRTPVTARPTDAAMLAAIQQLISIDIMDSTLLPESMVMTPERGVILWIPGPGNERIVCHADGRVIAWSAKAEESRLKAAGKELIP